MHVSRVSNSKGDTTILLLSLLDDYDDFVVYSDVINIGFKGMLMQRYRMIAYTVKYLKVY